MDNKLIYEQPSFVKEASADAFDPTKGFSVDGQRIDNQAAVWKAAAKLKEQELLGGSEISKEASDAIRRACDLFDISDKHFIIAPIKGTNFIVKEANIEAEFTILDNTSFSDVVDAVDADRAKTPTSFLRKAANELLSVKIQNGYSLTKEADSKLHKLAGTPVFDGKAVSDELNKRIDYCVQRNKDREVAVLRKLANACAQLPTDTAIITTASIVDAVDELDRSLGLINKLADYGMDYIDRVAYLTGSAAIAKQASEIIEIADTPVCKGIFMIPEKLDAMSKWASDNGYSTTAVADDVIDCVRSMPESLRQEFVELFK